MSIGEHATCPYCGHSNLIVGKDNAAVKELVEAAKEALAQIESALARLFDEAGRRQRIPVETRLIKAIKKVEGL